MQIIFKKDVYNIQSEREFRKMWLHIGEKLQRSNEIIAYITVNDTEIFDEFEMVILDNLNQWKDVTVKIVTQTVNEMIIDTVTSLREYLARLVPATEQVADKFYAGPESDDWSFFQLCIDGFEWVLQTCVVLLNIESEQFDRQKLHDVHKQLLEQFQELLQSLEAKQYNLVGDILLYEIQPLLNDLDKIVDTEQVLQ